MTQHLNGPHDRWSPWSKLLAVLIALSIAAALFDGAGNAVSTARTNMRAILDAISAESTAVTNQYLAGPETAAKVAAAMSLHTSLESAEERSLFVSLVNATPQVDAVYIGFPDGSFNFVARSTNDRAAFRFREIPGPDGMTKVTYVDENLTTVATEFDADDTYDPRVRTWYEAIEEGATTNWSEPYIFSSSDKLGVTYSVGVYDEASDLAAVVGVDVTIEELVAFLQERRPSENGSAQVVDNQGTVLASSDTDVDAQKAALEAGELPPRADWASTLIADAAIAPDGQQSALTSRRFQTENRWGNVRSVGETETWYLLVEAPDSDFGAESPGLLSGRTAQLLAISSLAGILALLVIGFAERRVVKLKKMATVDELTSVWNRAGIFRELGPALAAPKEGTRVLVAILDLDRFKQVNDSYGHTVGDQTLAEVGRRIANVADAHDMQAGRLGGDEFVVFGTKPVGESHKMIWDDVLETIEAVSWIGEAEVDLSASIGVAELSGPGVLTVTDALQVADRALYVGKRDGGSRTKIARPSATDTHEAIDATDPIDATDVTDVNDGADAIETSDADQPVVDITTKLIIK